MKTFTDVRVRSGMTIEVYKEKLYCCGFPCKLKILNKIDIHSGVRIDGSSTLGDLYEIMSLGMCLGEIMLPKNVQLN